MDFKEQLKAAADQCAEDQRNPADHLIRQAFYAGVGWYMAYLREKTTSPTDPKSMS
jgi:hypothetical protein